MQSHRSNLQNRQTPRYSFPTFGIKLVPQNGKTHGFFLKKLLVTQCVQPRCYHAAFASSMYVDFVHCRTCATFFLASWEILLVSLFENPSARVGVWVTGNDALIYW